MMQHTALCQCGRQLSPNDVRLGYTECKECEFKRLNEADDVELIEEIELGWEE
jgi:hypothetical protein